MKLLYNLQATHVMILYTVHVPIALALLFMTYVMFCVLGYLVRRTLL